MHVSIIANGFQEDYILNLINNLHSKVDRLDFIGSSIYDGQKINKQVYFYNLRGSHNENSSTISKTVRIIRYYIRLLNYLHHSDAEIVHIQWVRFRILEGIFFALYTRYFIGKKVIYTAHDVLPHSNDGIYNKILFKIIYSVHNHLIVHTAYLKDRLIQEFNIKSAKVSVIPHGMYERIENHLITKTKAREHFKISSNSTVLLFFGIIAEYKGLDILLKSLNVINDKKTFQILVAGRVSLEYKTKFEKLIKDNDCTNHVFFLRYIKDEEVEMCFKASDVTVLPYKEASQSGVLFMSYAYGIPVIAPNLGGFKHDIVPGKTGYLFQPNDHLSLADTLVKFKTEWDGTDKANDYIKNFASVNYSWDNSCKQIAELYSTVY